MTTKYTIFRPISYLGLLAVFMLSSVAALADPYLTAGVGFSNASSYIGTVGAGYKVNEWLRVEADTRRFTKSAEYGQSVSVGPQIILNPDLVNYQCSPCHDEQPEFNVKTTGNVLSLLFTTPQPNAFGYIRLGVMFRTDETKLYPTNVYTQDPTAISVANPNYTNAGPTSTTINSTQRVIGFGISGHGFYVEITGYGSSPGIYMSHDFFSSVIGYRLEL